MTNWQQQPIGLGVTRCPPDSDTDSSAWKDPTIIAEYHMLSEQQSHRISRANMIARVRAFIRAHPSNLRGYGLVAQNERRR